ncbi:MAG: hypothetical protein ACJAX1_003044, partial [Neolewinella sp.]
NQISDRLVLPLLPPKIISVAMLCKRFLAAAGTKTPGQKIWFYSIRVPSGLIQKLVLLSRRDRGTGSTLNWRFLARLPSVVEVASHPFGTELIYTAFHSFT